MRFILTFISLIFSLSYLSQNNFTSIQDGNWNDASTWTLGGGLGGVEGVDYPSASDNVTIDSYVIIDATNNGTNFSFTGTLTINAGDTLESQVGDNIAGFVLEGNGLMTNNGSFFTLDVTEEPDENAKIPYEFVCKGNSVFIGGINSFAFISDDWNIQENAQIFIDNLNCYAVSDDVIFDGASCFMYGEGNIRIGGDGPNSEVEFNNGASAAQLDDDITIWSNASSLTCGAPGTVAVVGTNTTITPPFAYDDNYTTGINVSQNHFVLTRGARVDFSPISGDALTITSVGSNVGATNGTTAQGGTVSVNNNGTPADPSDDFVNYTPAIGFTGIDTYNYLITNNGGGTDIAAVTVSVNSCGSGFLEDTTFTPIVSISNNTGVDEVDGDVIGSPDNDFAYWWDGGDILNMNFGQIFTAGTKYKITWRVRSGSTNAQPVIRESTTNGSFTDVLTPYTIANNTTQETFVTSENDFQYLQITKDNSVNATDFEIDAIEVIETTCLADNDNDGISNAIDLDDDNDGIKDGDENNCQAVEANWTLDNTTDDASDNNNDEVVLGDAPGFSTDAIQGTHSGNFNGTSNYIQYSNGSLLNDAFTEASFSLWIKPTNLSGIRAVFEEGGGVNGWVMYLNNGVPTISTIDASVQLDIVSSVTLTLDGEWHHIAGTFDNGIVTIYVDGVATTVDNSASYTSISAHGSDGGIGGFIDDNATGINGPGSYFEGLIDGIKYTNTEAWSAGEIGFECDNDGDGIANQFDLDSDNDGITDIIEAGGEDTNGDGKVDDLTTAELNNDSDSDGLDDRYDFSNGGAQISLPDTDNDGIFDFLDLDSDNDGIPDVVEVSGTDQNGDGRADNFIDADLDGFNDIVDADVGNDGFSENVANTLLISNEDTDNDGVPEGYPTDDKDGDDILNHLDLDADNDGIPDVVEQGGADVNGDGRADNYADADNDGFSDLVDGDPTNALGIGSDVAGTNSTNALILTGSDVDADGAPDTKPNGNLDQDGIYNFLDLDADGDGILDITEAGGTDANTDGIEDTFADVDNDGFNDNIDGDPTNVIGLGQDTLGANAANATTPTGEDTDNDGAPDSYPNDDFDGDGFLNHLDIDADNDGIVDNTEGQATTVAGGYIAPAGADADGDGIDDAYDADDANFGGSGSGFVLSDIDNANDPNTPDYLDLDSDNDGDLDEIEGHDTDNDGVADGSSPSNAGLPGGTTDTDGDGLLDGYDNNTSSTDPTNNSLLGDSHPNIDISATVEHDWREALDNDEDGVPDFSDLDDDNDGILDSLECSIEPVFVTNADAFWSLDGNTNDVSGSVPTRNQQGGTGPTSYSTNSIQGTNSGFFNGTTDEIQYSDGTFMNSIYTEISFSAWINPDLVSADRVIYEEGGSTHGSVLWVNAGVLTYTTRNSNNQTDLTHPTALTVNQWQHVACTFDNGVMTVYLNGVPASTNTVPATSDIPLHGDAGGIGGTLGGSTSTGGAVGNFSGLIDAARYSNTEAWSAADILAEADGGSGTCDTDGDGILNQFDLDSDNDGIPDIVEAGGEDTDGNGLVDDINPDGTLILGTDTDNDGLADVYDANNGGADIPNPDTDGDGINDALDLDADNDGIPDVVEAGGTDADGDGIADNFAGNDSDEDGFNDYVDGDPDQDGTSDNTANALIVTGADTGTDGIPDSYPNADNDEDGILNHLDLDADDDGIPDVVEQGGTDVNGDGRADNYSDADSDGFNDVLDTDLDNDGMVDNAGNSLLITGADGDSDGAPDTNPNGDFDGDDVFNFLDLDADDDGILDVIEAGGTDANNDGQEDGAADADGDGFNDAVDGDPDNSMSAGTDTLETEAVNATTLTAADGDNDGAPDSYPNDDFDGDGYLNHLDIDADNDGIVDNTEGQATTVAGGYLAPDNADADGDGIDDAYDNIVGFGGAGVTPPDADVAVNPGTPDYLDLDADNDEDLDAIEGHDTDNDGAADGTSVANTGLPGGTTDIDGDGLLDGYDNNTASQDPTNGNLLGDSHPNLDLTSTDEHDWREALDNDEDGIPDFADLDDDNDGILDEDERALSCVTVNAPILRVTDSDLRTSSTATSGVINDGVAIDDQGIDFNNTAHYAVIDLGSVRGALSTIRFDWWQNGSSNINQHTITQVATGTTISPGTNPLSVNYQGLGTSGFFVYTLTQPTQFLLIDMTVRNSSRVEITEATIELNCSGTTEVDTDGDGIANQFDLDSDNDGVPDIVEAGGEDENGDGVVDDITGTTLDNDANNDGLDDRYDPTNTNNTSIGNGDADGDGVPNALDLDSDNDGIPDVVEAGGTDANGDGRVDNYASNDGDGFSDVLDSDLNNDGTIDNAGNELAITGNDGDGDGVPDTYPNGDLDQDGILNYYDLDADDDGIMDVTEAGGSDTDRDGIEDAFIDADEDGYNDNVDGDIDNSLAVGDDSDGGEQANATTLTGADGNSDGTPDSYPNNDFDGDGLYNFIDIDADNDGIVDNTEGQSTAGYIAPVNADLDGDGIDNAYDDLNGFGGNGAVGYLLSDIDVADDPNSPDYLDLNSDGDFYADVIEGHDSNGDGIVNGSDITIANTGLPGGITDIDNDGLLDGYDNNTASTDPTNVGLEGLDHPNTTNAATTERDWREEADRDNDGISDNIDIDRDNDGILDVDECASTGTYPIFGSGASTTNFSQDDVTAAYLDVTTVDNAFSVTVNGGVLNVNNVLQFQENVLSAGEVLLEFASDGGLSASPWVANTQGLPRVRLIINSSGEVSIVGSRTTTSTALERMRPRDGTSFNSINFVSGANNFSVVNPAETGGTNINATAFLISSCDTDNDGIPDYLDLDSDNDGIADIVEAGGTDLDNDGVVDVFNDVNNDGWADTFDSNEGGSALADSDQDGDGFPNRIDLDSDDDGLADIIEAGGADTDNNGIGDNPADEDADGWLSLFDGDNGGSVLPVPDTDGDGTLPNYLDLDSDNDGIIDNIEWQTTSDFEVPSGIDANGNGWDDEYDDGPIPQAISNNNGAGDPDYLDQNSDGDAQPDWLERADDDEDGDALLDLIAIADAYEAANANPLHYVSTDDIDGDDIPDFLESAGALPAFLTPGNTLYRDSDNDGIVDLYDADQNGDARGVVTQLGELDNDGAPDFRDTDDQISLPIELVRFTATKVGESVQLDWTTATEINNDYFTIERSVDGENFEPILTQDGAGTSSKVLHYKKIDNKPLEGYNYYRLKQTDYNGDSKAFNIEVVKFERGSSSNSLYNVYPNPTTGKQLFLEINQPKVGLYQVEIRSSVGQLLNKRIFQIESETIYFEQEMLRRLNLAKGVYFLRIQVNGELEVFKFIVQ